MLPALAPLTDADAPELLAAVEESRADMGHVSWAPLVVDLASAEAVGRALGAFVVRVAGRFVGLVALQPLGVAHGLAYWVRVSEQRKGYALAACRELLATAPGLVVAEPDEDNARSRALLERLGFAAQKAA